MSLTPLFTNPSTGKLETAKELGEWAAQPMTEDEKKHGFEHEGGFAGWFDLDEDDPRARPGS